MESSYDEYSSSKITGGRLAKSSADATSLKLVKTKEKLEGQKVEHYAIPFPETNADGEKRPRWKYVAKVVDTRALKKKGRRVKTYTNNNTSILIHTCGMRRLLL